MPIVELIGHENSYPVTDIMRLFFGPDLHCGDRTVSAGSDGLSIRSIMAAEPSGQTRITTAWERGGESWKTSHTVEARMARREIKRQLYQALALLTGLSFPWGSLTGIRPTQVAAEALRMSGQPVASRRELIETWFVSPEKADLAVETAIAENRLLAFLSGGTAMVYVGIPFCPSRCAYCSFIAQDAHLKDKLQAPYVEAVLSETEQLLAGLPQHLKISSVYFGGGTPTSLPERLFERLLTGVLTRLPLAGGVELTVEAGRPDTINSENLAIIRNAGVKRICINPQTFHDATLDRIGRRHTVEQTVEACRMAEKMGFDSINMDLIAGLPGEMPADFYQSLRKALNFGPANITVHTLAMKRSSRLNQLSREKGFHPGLPDPELAEMLIDARRLLAENDLFPYYLYRQKDVAGGLENTGFARPGHECLYNVGMMSDQVSVIGLGSGAISKNIIGSRVERSPNPRDIADYINRADEMAARKIKLFRNGAV